MSSKLKKMLLAAGGLPSLLSMSAFAEGETADAANTQVSGFAQYGTIIWLIIIVAVFYFMILRPQKKKEKADRMLRNSLQPGDKIVTIGGFVGRIISIKDDEVTFETGAAKNRMTVKKWAIQTKEGGSAEVKAKETKDEVKAAEATPDELTTGKDE